MEWNLYKPTYCEYSILFSTYEYIWDKHQQNAQIIRCKFAPYIIATYNLCILLVFILNNKNARWIKT
jgi:hypothetical protein